ncbi:hypothetical protein BKA66DRAFT_412019 [Pyrenochaeta sp. MPI-SDFR-AT-0127]|nr:hypothetical protein BKA66DRAFT_412019 [Pyrenochaeta sp. MPI-SDFR-AT-0127]
MKSVFSIIAKQQPKTFRVSYTPEHKTFITQHVAADPSHPLHETQKRRQRERKKEGLWWHATTGVDLSKSSCVRAWARRRLRNAVRDELAQRGFSETGQLVNMKAVRHREDLMNVLRHGKSLHLTGSLRLHAQSPLIPAKYAQIRAETGQVIETILHVIKNEAGVQGSVRKPSSRPQRTLMRASPQASMNRMRSGQTP